MGFFGALKDNFTGGGVKVDLNAPAQISLTDPSVGVTVIVSARKLATMEHMTVEIIREVQGVSNANNAASQPGGQTIAMAEYAQPFTLGGGESKSVPIDIPLDMTAQAAAVFGNDGAGSAIIGGLSKLKALEDTLHGTTYRYQIRATVQVSGLYLQPTVNRWVEVAGAGRSGGTFTVNL